MKNLNKTAEYVLSALLNAGADKAQCVTSEGKKEEFNIDAGEFSLLRSVFNSSVSMKVLVGGKMGQTLINSLDPADIDAAAAECVQSALASMEDDAVAIAEREENADFTDGTTAPERDRFFARLQEFMGDVGREYPKILMEQLLAEYVESEAVIANTNGVRFAHRCANYSVGAMYSAHDGDLTTSFNHFSVEYTDPDARILDLGMTRDMLRRCEEELAMQPFEGKFEGTAVFLPACLGDILSMVMNCFCGDVSMIEGTSPWSFSLGTPVASEALTLSVLPLDERIVCGERVTDDGYRAGNYDIIRKGVLTSFCLSDYAARKTGHSRAANSSGSIVVEPGDTPFAELLGGIEKGILVCRFSGGEPATNGDFSGVAKNSFLIENGKIACPVSETMISGNLAQMVKNVTAISKETYCDGSSVLPYVAFGGVTVSGK